MLWNKKRWFFGFDAKLKKDSKFYVDAESFQVQIPEEFYDKISSKEGSDIIFGIRPEDMRDEEFMQNPKKEYKITAKVEVIEPMGSENFLYLTSGKHYFVSRVDSRSKARRSVGLNHLFRSFTTSSSI